MNSLVWRFTMRTFRTIVLIAGVAMIAVGSTANAVPVTYNFELTVPDGTPVTDLVLFTAGAGEDDIFLSTVVLPASGISQLTHSVDFTPTEALVLGINARATEAKWDVVMFTNNTFASAAQGLRFGELFPADRNPRHGELTLLLQAAHDGDAASLNAVADFLRGDDISPALFDPNGSFSIIQWSGANGIGGSIPEPGTLALFGIGLVGLGYMRRRKAAQTESVDR